MNEIPCSGPFDPERTDSLVIIWFTVKCLPDVTQELEKTDLTEPVTVVDEQRLSVSGRWREVQEPLHLRTDASRFAFIWSSSRSARSSVLPPGSPTIAVPPPATAIGLCPPSWRRRSIAKLKQAADVQAVGGRVEPDVRGEPLGVEPARAVQGLSPDGRDL